MTSSFAIDLRILGLLAINLFNLSLAETQLALPSPPYPSHALEKGWQGTVVVKTHFDTLGKVESCQVVRTSGHDLLDDRTVDFIERHWSSPQLANQTVTRPIEYRLTVDPVSAPLKTADTLEDLLCSQGYRKIDILRGATNTDLIAVKINDKSFTLRVDTGAFTTIITKRAADHANFKGRVLHNFTVSGVNGELHSTAALLDKASLSVNNQNLHSSEVLIAEYSDDQLYDQKWGDCQGLLGLKDLKANRAVLVINPPLLFVPQGQACRDTDSFLRSHHFRSLPLTDLNGQYLLTVTLDGLSARMLIDTGAEYSIISNNFLKRNNFSLERYALRQIGMDSNIFNTRAVSFKEVFAQDFPFGPQMVTSGNPSIFDPGSNNPHLDGILGYDLLGGPLTVIDMATDRIYLHSH